MWCKVNKPSAVEQNTVNVEQSTSNKLQSNINVEPLSCSEYPPTQADIEEKEELSEEEEMDYDFSQISQLKSFPDWNDDDPYEQENVAEEPMVILSQKTLSSQSEYEPSEDGLASQDEASLCEDQTETSSFGKQWVFLIYEQKLQELLP